MTDRAEHNMDHMKFLEVVAAADVSEVRRKEATYQGSWKRRGGVGAFMMLARKWDRLEPMVSGPPTIAYDIFAHIASSPEGRDGTALAEVRDLRRYLMLVEAEMMSRGVVSTKNDLVPGTPEDGGHHAARDEVEPRDGITGFPPSWPCILSADSVSGTLFYNVDRRVVEMKRPTMLQRELNAKEYELAEPRFRGMYKWTAEDEGKYRLHQQYWERWGR